MKGNPISYYNRNEPGLEPDFVYAIWYPQNSGWCYQYHLASFKTMEQLVKFATLLDFKFFYDEKTRSGYCDKTIYNDFTDKDVRETVDKAFDMAFYSDNQSDSIIGNTFLEHRFEAKCFAYGINAVNLACAKTFKSLSNGHIVDNLFVSDKDEVRIYRCNPNAKDFYKPLSLEEQIEFSKENGSY